MSKQRGSGVTTEDIMKELQEQSATRFEVQVNNMVKNRMVKNRVEPALFVSSFRDGMRTMLAYLKEMGVVAVFTNEELADLRK